APSACAGACDSGAPPRPSRGRAAPRASRSCAAISFPGTPLRAAFSSSRLAEPGRRCCRERGLARALLSISGRVAPAGAGTKFSTPRRGCEGVPGDEPGDRRLYPAPAAPHIGVMALLKIAHMGHPVLRDRARAVDDPTAPWVRRLFEDMVETMEDAGGTGLAAPQVHMPWRIVVFRVGGERLTDLPGDSEQDLTALINPVIE